MSNKKSRESDDFDAVWEDDLDVEIVDLDALDDIEAGSNKAYIPSWSVEPVLRWQRAFNRKHWRAISITCSVVLVCLVLFLNLHVALALLTNARNSIASRLIKPPPILSEKLPMPVNIAPALVIPLARVGFTCITSEAWSPDSASVALLGYSSGCEYDSDNAVGLATIQDARTGQRLLQLQPDVLISKAFYAQYSAIHDVLVLYYQTVSWSPNNKQLAVLFDAHTKSQIGGAGFSGLLLFNQEQRRTQVLIQQRESADSYQIGVSSYTEWDTKLGEILPTPVVENIDPFVFNSNIPAAEEYTWNNNGTLIPQTHKTVHSSTIGNTNGGSSFTVWQPGGVELIKQDQSGVISFKPGIFVWDVGFVTWSPDGRYLINGAFLVARLEPPGHPRPNHKTLVTFHMEDLPVLPIRDAALLSVLKLLSSAQMVGALYHMNVAWSPNGRLMGMTTYEQAKKNLYSSMHGYPVASLQAPKTTPPNVQSSHQGYYSFSYVDWSPDSTHILAQDPATNAVVIWNIPAGLK